MIVSRTLRGDRRATFVVALHCLVALLVASSPRAHAQTTRPAVERIDLTFNDGSQQRFLPAPPPTTAPARAPRSLLGMNVEGVRDHARSRMFIDTIKMSRTFGQPDKPWTGRAPVDADGWPTQDFGVVVMTEAINASGVYTLSCRGFARIKPVASKAAVRNVRYDEATDTTTADVVFSPDPKTPSGLFLSFTETRGGVRDLKLLRPGYTSDENIFTDEFLKSLEPFGALRFMDYLQTNDSTLSRWSDRPKVTDAQYTSARGAPYELAIELGNRAGKDIWLNIPVSADDEFITELAKLVKANFRPDLNCYLEYSNELWNGIFDQEETNLDLARQEVAAGDLRLSVNGTEKNQYYWAWRRVGRRSMEIAELFRAVCGDDPRIRVVLCGQHVRPQVLQKALDYIVEHGGEPSRYLCGIATARYFGYEKAVMSRPDLTIDEIVQVVLKHAAGANSERAKELRAMAQKYGLRPMAYEGGIDLGPGSESLQAKLDAQYDPRTGEAVEQFLSTWFDNGGDVFMWYKHTNRSSRHGVWGLTEDAIDLAAPKIQAAIRVAERYKQ